MGREIKYSAARLDSHLLVKARRVARMAYMYILKSKKEPKTYVGSTTDLSRRLLEHNAGKHSYTKRHMPWVVVYKEEFANLADARAREKYLKSAAGRRWIKQMKIIPR